MSFIVYYELTVTALIHADAQSCSKIVININTPLSQWCLRETLAHARHATLSGSSLKIYINWSITWSNLCVTRIYSVRCKNFSSVWSHLAVRVGGPRGRNAHDQLEGRMQTEFSRKYPVMNNYMSYICTNRRMMMMMVKMSLGLLVTQRRPREWDKQREAQRNYESDDRPWPCVVFHRQLDNHSPLLNNWLSCLRHPVTLHIIAKTFLWFFRLTTKSSRLRH